MRLDAGIVHQQDLTIEDSGGAKLSYDNGFRFDFIVGVTSTNPGARRWRWG